jgi:hypothetical protein
MRRIFIFSITTILIHVLGAAGFAQNAKGPEGRWTGRMQVPNAGDMEVAVSFKKDNDAYTGSLTVIGMSEERPFKSVKVEGDIVQAQSEFAMPDGKVLVNFTFTLKDDALTGKGVVDFGGQSQNIELNINLKRLQGGPSPD